MNSKPNLTPNLRQDIQKMLSEVPTSCADVRLYPAGLNFCECYLLAEAIKEFFEPDAAFKVTLQRAPHTVKAKEIDADYVYRMCLNDEGGGAEFRDLDDTVFFSLDREDSFALLAGKVTFLRRAIPFPDDIWATYFEQIMKANEPRAYELVLEEFSAWKRKSGRAR